MGTLGSPRLSSATPEAAVAAVFLEMETEIKSVLKQDTMLRVVKLAEPSAVVASALWVSTAR